MRVLVHVRVRFDPEHSVADLPANAQVTDLLPATSDAAVVVKSKLTAAEDGVNKSPQVIAVLRSVWHQTAPLFTREHLLSTFLALFIMFGIIAGYVAGPPAPPPPRLALCCPRSKSRSSL